MGETEIISKENSLEANVDRNISVCQPVVVALLAENSRTFCNFCLRPFPKEKLKVCTQCEFSAYCGEDCQQQDFDEGHCLECSRLKGRYQDWLKLDKVGEKSSAFLLMLIRLLFRTHLDRDTVFNIFCKAAINSHAITTWALDGGQTTIGVSLFIDMSAYNHSCRPNAEIMWHGRTAFVVPLFSNLDTHKTDETFITYTDPGNTPVCRQLWLQRYYFRCGCERCEKPELQLSAIRCESCSDSVHVNEIIFDDENYQQSISCKSCGQKQSTEYVEKIVSLLYRLLSYLFETRKCALPYNLKFIGMKHLTTSEQRDLCQRLYNECVPLFPKSNFYFAVLAEKLGHLSLGKQLEKYIVTYMDAKLLVEEIQTVLSRNFVFDNQTSCYHPRLEELVQLLTETLPP